MAEVFRQRRKRQESNAVVTAAAAAATAAAAAGSSMTGAQQINAGFTASFSRGSRFVQFLNFLIS